jgi:hypothetical protein
MIQPINIRTVRAFGISLLLLGSLAVGGCACTGDSNLRDLGDLLCCSHRPHVRRATSRDPCVSFHPTCWRTWSEYCGGLPPGGEMPFGAATEGAGMEMPPAGHSANLEVVPTPPQEPRVINLPPPPQDAPAGLKRLAVPPLPQDDLRAPSPDKTNALPTEDAKTGQPHALQGTTLGQGIAGNDSRSRESDDLEGARELVALRRSVAPLAPRALLPRVPADPSQADEKPRGEEAAFLQFSHCTLLDYSTDDNPGVSSVAMFFGRESLDR